MAGRSARPHASPPSSPTRSPSAASAFLQRPVTVPAPPRLPGLEERKGVQTLFGRGPGGAEA